MGKLLLHPKTLIQSSQCTVSCATIFSMLYLWHVKYKNCHVITQLHAEPPVAPKVILGKSDFKECSLPN